MIGEPSAVPVSNSRTSAGRLPEFTGRHLVLLSEGSTAGAMTEIMREAGLRVATTSDCEDGVLQESDVAGADGMVLTHLGVAVVNAEPEQLVHLQATVSSVLAIEQERVVQACTSPDERDFTWGLQVTSAALSRFTGKGVKVAVLDTGCDFEHPDFLGRTIARESFVPGQAVQDGHGHGTHCCGTVCGRARPQELPRYGVAPDAELHVGKVLDDDSRGQDLWVLAGIEWAMTRGCRIASMSLAARPLPQHSRVFEEAARRARRRGTILVAAAGNDSGRDDRVAPVSHPANCPSILAVAAIDPALRVASFSNCSLDPAGGQVDLAAPGVAVRSSWRMPARYRSADGTSAATAHAAGVAALHVEANPGITAPELFKLLVQTALRLPLPSVDVGAGLVQAPL